MEGSGSGNWTLNATYSIQTLSEMNSIRNDITSTHNVTDIQLTCEEITGQFGESLLIPLNVETALRYIQAVYYIIIFVVGVSINVFVVALSLCFKKLQNVTFLLGLQVCVGDMLNAVITLPSSTANAIANRFVFTGSCSVFGLALFSLGLARTYLMFVLVLDRFCNVFMPFWYQRHRTRFVLYLSLGAWVLAFIVGLVPTRGLLDCYSVVRTGWICYPRQGCNLPGECLIFTWTVILLTNLISVVSLVLYSALFCKAKKLRNQVCVALLPDVNTEEERSATTWISKRDRKANVTFFLLFLALIGITLPPVIISFIGRIISNRTHLPTAYAVVEILAGSLMFPLLTVIDPLVITRNEDFTEVIKTIINKLANSCNQEVNTQ
jgi:hypothetical protein